jgi:hypothetical protein
MCLSSSNTCRSDEIQGGIFKIDTFVDEEEVIFSGESTLSLTSHVCPHLPKPKGLAIQFDFCPTLTKVEKFQT